MRLHQPISLGVLSVRKAAYGSAVQQPAAALGSVRADLLASGVARVALAGWLAGFLWADEAILIASEFATNSVLHSASRHGGAFILRAEVSLDRLRIEADHPQWSAYWDKKHGLWRVAEDDPDSDLYAESSDADTVISCIVAHA